jgi:hypothetical protein
MSAKKEFIKKVILLQQRLVAPKGQTNQFGGYKYRSNEDIIEAIKPIAHDLGLLVYQSDEMVFLEGRHYVKATTTITDGEFEINTNGWAREPENQKGMQEPQLTGSCSSYARKYSTAGATLADDNKDPDHGNDKAQHPTLKGNTDVIAMAQKGQRMKDEQAVRIKDNPFEIANDQTPYASIPVNEVRKRITQVLMAMNEGDIEKSKADVMLMFGAHKTSDLKGKDLQKAYEKVIGFAVDGLAYEKEHNE